MSITKKTVKLRKRIFADVDVINHKDLKVAAAQQGISIKELIEKALREYAARHKPEQTNV